MECSLGSSTFLEVILSFPFYCFLYFFALRKSFLSLLDILWNSTFKWVYLPFSPLFFASLVFTALSKASLDSHFAFLHFFFLRYQFSSVAQSCPTFCDPMNHSTPGLSVHHQVSESTQTNVHWVGDAIQPSHPLSSPSPPALNLSQHQSLFNWSVLGWTGWISLQSKGLSRVFSNTTVQKHQFFSTQLSL